MERLINFFNPTNYKLSLNLDKHKKTREGKVVISGESKSETIKFHCVGTEVDYVKKNDEKVDFKLEISKIIAKNSAIKKGEILLPEQARHLAQQLLQLDEPNFSPYGKPVFVQIPENEITKKLN